MASTRGASASATPMLESASDLAVTSAKTSTTMASRKLTSSCGRNAVKPWFSASRLALVAEITIARVLVVRMAVR